MENENKLKAPILSNYEKDVILRNKAMDVLEKSWELVDRESRIMKAKEALAIFPDCYVAFKILSQESDSLEDKKKYLKKAIVVMYKTSKNEGLEEFEGKLWEIRVGQIYMKLCEKYMELLYETDCIVEAAEQAKEMIKLNTHDNQGIRHRLILFLLKLKKYDELDKHINQSEYKDDAFVDTIYSRALLSFILGGDTEKAKIDLKLAVSRNQYVHLYLCNKIPFIGEITDHIRFSSREEAFYYVTTFKSSWVEIPGAIEWLNDNTEVKAILIGRNDLCSCGSGKKFKKCCSKS